MNEFEDHTVKLLEAIEVVLGTIAVHIETTNKTLESMVEKFDNQRLQG